MLPSFGKDRIIEDIRITRSELAELAVIYKDAGELMRKTKFTQAVVVAMLEQFKRVVGTGSDNMIVYIDKNLKLVIDNLTAAENMVVKSLNSTIAASGLTFRQATVIQYVNLIHFVNKYARKLLHYIYVVESSQYEQDPKEALKALSKPDQAWLEENFLAFCNAFKSATFTTDDVASKMDDIPEAVINETTSRTLNNTVGPAKMDPLKLGFAGSWMNPIYFVRMIIAEWQVKRYQVSKEEIAVLRLRRMQLENQRDGKENAKLEKEIAYFESRIQTLSYELAEVEKKYG